MIGLKAENYLLNCRVETISSPSKTAPRIFQTSPEHPNARIIITPPYAQKGRASSSGDIFDPQLPSKPRKVSTSNNDDSSRRTSGRKRTATEKVYDYSTESDDILDEPKRRPAKAPRTSDAKDVTTPPQGESRRRKSSSKLVESTESTPKKKEEKEKMTNRLAAASKLFNREKEARLDRRENEELYEALQKQVTVDLLKRRYRLYWVLVLTVGVSRRMSKKRWLWTSVANSDLIQIRTWQPELQLVFVIGWLINPGAFEIISKF